MCVTRYYKTKGRELEQVLIHWKYPHELSPRQFLILDTTDIWSQIILWWWWLSSVLENIWQHPYLYALDASSRPPHPPTCPQKPSVRSCRGKMFLINASSGTNSLSHWEPCSMAHCCCFAIIPAVKSRGHAWVQHWLHILTRLIVFHRKEPEFLGGCWNLYERESKIGWQNFETVRKKEYFSKVLDQHLKKGLSLLRQENLNKFTIIITSDNSGKVSWISYVCLKH